MTGTILNEAIRSLECILDALKEYSMLVNNGNNCAYCCNKDCEWRPKSAEIVRYNCPHFEKWRPEE